MGSRKDLNEILVTILGSSNVYFQPPENVKLTYPCIIYVRDDIQVLRASNVLHKISKKYTITLIGNDVDTDLPERLLELETVSFDRRYIKDGLVHDVLSLFY
jgi:hypothetical protein